MTVPKCKDCKNYYQFNIGKHVYSECYSNQLYAIGKKIHAVDRKTSPQWCPKRLPRVKEED